MSIKGYSTSEMLERLAQKFATLEPTRLNQYALSVLAHQFVRIVGTDAAEAGSTTSSIVATAHASQKGDVIRFTAGALSGTEVKVFSTSTNAIVPGEDLASAPGVGDTFEILRHKYPIVDSFGNVITAGLFKFLKNTVETNVSYDTVVPANNTPLPVMLLDTAGNINQVDAAQSGFWDIRDVTGAVSLPTGASTEATLAALEAKDFATETTLATVAADVASLDSKDFATEAKQDDGNASLASIDAKIVAVDTTAVQVASSALPAGAATEVTLAAVDAKLPATLGQKVMASSLAVALASDQSAIPVTGTFWQATQPVSGTFWQAIQPVSGTVAVSNFPGTVAVSNFPASQAVTGTFWQATQPVSGTFWQATQPISAAALPLPTGASTEATLALISAAVSRLDVIDFIDTTPVLDTSSTNITASSGNPVAIVATLAAAVKKIMVNDTTGAFIGVYTGAALSEVLQCVVGPGLSGAIEVQMAAGERVSLRNMANTAITDGMIAIQFIG